MALHAARLSLPVDRRRQSLISTRFVLFFAFSVQVQQGGSRCSEVEAGAARLEQVQRGGISFSGRCSEVGGGAARWEQVQ